VDIFSGIKFVGASIVIVLGFWAWNEYDKLSAKLDAAVDNLNVSEANNDKLKFTIDQQQITIKRQIEDAKKVQEANSRLQETNNTLQTEYKDLDKRFNESAGKQRDITALAIKKTSAVERIINKASLNAFRCAELAMGAPLTQEELDATKKSQINPECPGIANPNYTKY